MKKFIVILAGGSGTRFWPMSTKARPKQFLNLFGPRSMLQETSDRLPEAEVLVITAQEHVALVQEQLPFTWVVGEPESKDTAAAVVLATAICRNHADYRMLKVAVFEHRTGLDFCHQSDDAPRDPARDHESKQAP